MAATGSSLKCISILSLPDKKFSSGVATTKIDNKNDPIPINYKSSSQAWQCSWSRDGNYIACCYGIPDPCIRIWKKGTVKDTSINHMDGEEKSSKEGNSWILTATLRGIHERTIRSISFAPTRTYPILASASFDGTVAIWEYNPDNDAENISNNDDDNDANDNGWECIAQLEGHDNEVKCVTWNSSGSLLGTCGRDKSVWIWECSLPGTIGGPSAYSSMGGGSGGAEFECLAVLNGHEGDVKDLTFAPSHGQWGDGDEILLSASYDDTIKVWAEDDGDWYCAMTISSIHTSTIWSICIAPGGTRLVSGSSDGSLAIYKHYTSLEKKQKFTKDEIEKTSIGNGNYYNNNNGLWKCVGTLPGAHNYRVGGDNNETSSSSSAVVYSVHCAPAQAGHGRIASCGSDNCINIYKEVLGGSSDQPLFALDTTTSSGGAHGDYDVNNIRWHPWDGSLLASTGDDGTVRIWKYRCS